MTWGFALWHALGFVLASLVVGMGYGAFRDREMTKTGRYLWAFMLWTVGVAMWLKVLAQVMEVMP